VFPRCGPKTQSGRAAEVFRAGHSEKHSIPGLRMLVMVWGCGIPRGEDGSGGLPRADARLLFALQEAGGSAGGTKFYARNTVSQQVQQFSRFFNFVL
jgi:hypothetical protein